MVSANDSESLKGTMERFISRLDDSTYDLASISYTSAMRRDHYRFRTFIVTDSVPALKSSLQMKLLSLDAIQPIPLLTPHIVFVFCGVGTAWNGMCADLIGTFSAFRNAVTEVDKLLFPMTNWSIMEILQKKLDVLNNPMVNHIAIFTCQIALLRLLNSFGIFQKAVIGQSVGEVAAACASGALTLDQAVRVIFLRSKHLASAVGGKMSVIRGVDIETVEKACRAVKRGKVVIAVYISHECCTVSGDKEAVDDLKQMLGEDLDFAAIDLKVECAYHSHFTSKSASVLEKELEEMNPSMPNIPVFSSVTGKRITSSNYATATYWACNVKDPVYFRQAVSESASHDDHLVYIEVGPSPVLRPHLANIVPDRQTQIFPSMTKGRGLQTIFESIGEVYTLGHAPKLDSIVDQTSSLTDIPKYVFNKHVSFVESNKRSTKRRLNNDKRTTTSVLEPIPRNANEFSVVLNDKIAWYIFEHLVEGSVIVPGAFYGNIGLEVGKRAFSVDTDLQVGWSIQNPLALQSGDTSTLYVQCNKVRNIVEYSVRERTGTALSTGFVSKSHHKQCHIDIETKVSELLEKTS